LIFEDALTNKIKNSKTKYSLKKTSSILFYFVLGLAILAIWVENAQAILVSYGLIAAGVAIALQDFFKNIVGGIVLFVSGFYRVGDRIEINSKLGEWIDGGQTTGRIISFPNSMIL
jgi:small-conductance mechanosensitive channel